MFAVFVADITRMYVLEFKHKDDVHVFQGYMASVGWAMQLLFTADTKIAMEATSFHNMYAIFAGWSSFLIDGPFWATLLRVHDGHVASSALLERVRTGAVPFRASFGGVNMQQHATSTNLEVLKAQWVHEQEARIAKSARELNDIYYKIGRSLDAANAWCFLLSEAEMKRNKASAKEDFLSGLKLKLISEAQSRELSRYAQRSRARVGSEVHA